METKRRQHSAEFKAKVALDALGGQHTLAELATKYEVHPIQISKWKTEFEKQAAKIFARGKDREAEEKDKLIEDLYRKVGKAGRTRNTHKYGWAGQAPGQHLYGAALEEREILRSVS